MIWLFLLLWAFVILVGLWRLGHLTKATLQLLGAALLLAAAGYAWQGRPGLASSPAQPVGRQALPETPFAALRGNFFERFDRASSWLIIADGYQRRGDSASAVGVLRSALRAHPNNASLWTGLGNALVIHGRGMNPAARLAYRRAAALAPGHPAPLFFYGMNLIETGDIEGGERVWRDLLARAPADASWRPVIADRLAIIDQLRAMQQAPTRR